MINLCRTVEKYSVGASNGVVSDIGQENTHW